MQNLQERDKKYLLNVYKRINLNIVKGEGSYLYDDKGDKYLDMFSGISVNHLGHMNQEIINSIIKQVSSFIHLSNYFVSESVVNLAELLVENTHASKVFFTNSGTEANEAAIKLARKFGKSIKEDKTEILSAHNSFHGRTLGGLSLTGQLNYQSAFSPLMPNVEHFVYNDIQSLKAKVSDKTCAVFIEIIQGEGGIVEITPSFVKALKELSKKNNFLIVVDEIQTGIGRTGAILASQCFDFTPHITTLAKSIGGGLPLGAMLVSSVIEGVLSTGDHGSTFGGNPVACAAGVKVVNTIIDEDFRSEVYNKGKYLFQQLENLKLKFPKVIKDIRGKGLMIGIDVGEYASLIKDMALENKVLLNITKNTIIRLLPPLSISIDEINIFLRSFELILKDLYE